MVSFFALPLEVRLFIFISSLIIALDMVMFILFQNTSWNVFIVLDTCYTEVENQLIK